MECQVFSASHFPETSGFELISTYLGICVQKNCGRSGDQWKIVESWLIWVFRHILYLRVSLFVYALTLFDSPDTTTVKRDN